MHGLFFGCTEWSSFPKSSLNDVQQDEFIVDIVITTCQTGESIPHSIVRKDTLLDLSNNVAIVVC